MTGSVIRIKAVSSEMKVNHPTPRIQPSDVNRHNTPQSSMGFGVYVDAGIYANYNVYCTALDWFLSSKVVCR